MEYFFPQQNRLRIISGDSDLEPASRPSISAVGIWHYGDRIAGREEWGVEVDPVAAAAGLLAKAGRFTFAAKWEA